MWGGESCNSFIAIHAEMMVDDALCPVRADALLKYYDS